MVSMSLGGAAMAPPMTPMGRGAGLLPSAQPGLDRLSMEQQQLLLNYQMLLTQASSLNMQGLLPAMSGIQSGMSGLQPGLQNPMLNPLFMQQATATQLNPVLAQQAFDFQGLSGLQGASAAVNPIAPSLQPVGGSLGRGGAERVMGNAPNPDGLQRGRPT